MAAETIVVSLSAKVAASLSEPAAVELSSLFAIRSRVGAAVRELELLRAFLRFADSRRGTGDRRHLDQSGSQRCLWSQAY